MRLLKHIFLFGVLVCSCGVTHASLESEQAILNQLTQALQDARRSLADLDAEVAANQQKSAEEQQAVLAATADKDTAQATLDNLTAQQASHPAADVERKIKDAEYEVMMAERRLSSANKSLERAEKKLQDSLTERDSLKGQISQTEKSVAEQQGLVNKVKSAGSEEAMRKQAEEKARQQEAEQRAAEQAAAEEARKAAELEERARKEKLMKELGVDLNGCMPLPQASGDTQLTDVDRQLQPFALGELRRVNRLLEEAVEGEPEPLSPAPVLQGSKLKPCDPQKWQALRFSYLGSGQYRLETPVLSGEQEFVVQNVVPPIRRVIPESDNGAVYVFFLDVKFPGRYKLSAYKKILFDQPAPP